MFAVNGRRSVECERTDVALEVHHLDGDPSNNARANTIPLCCDCHRGATFPGN